MISLGVFPQLNFYFEKHQNFGKDKRLVQQTACIPHLESPTVKILPHLLSFPPFVCMHVGV